MLGGRPSDANTPGGHIQWIPCTGMASEIHTAELNAAPLPVFVMSAMSVPWAPGLINGASSQDPSKRQMRHDLPKGSEGSKRNQTTQPEKALA